METSPVPRPPLNQRRQERRACVRRQLGELGQDKLVAARQGEGRPAVEKAGDGLLDVLGAKLLRLYRSSFAFIKSPTRVVSGGVERLSGFAIALKPS